MLSERARKICFCLILVDFSKILKQTNKVSRGHDRRTQGGGRVGDHPGEGGMNIKIPPGRGLFPYGGIFSMWAVFSLHVGAIFSGGGGGLSQYGRGHFWTGHP